MEHLLGNCHCGGMFLVSSIWDINDAKCNICRQAKELSMSSCTTCGMDCKKLNSDDEESSPNEGIPLDVTMVDYRGKIQGELLAYFGSYGSAILVPITRDGRLLTKIPFGEHILTESTKIQLIRQFYNEDISDEDKKRLIKYYYESCYEDKFGYLNNAITFKIPYRKYIKYSELVGEMILDNTPRFKQRCFGPKIALATVAYWDYEEPMNGYVIYPTV